MLADTDNALNRAAFYSLIHSGEKSTTSYRTLANRENIRWREYSMESTNIQGNSIDIVVVLYPDIGDLNSISRPFYFII